MPLCPSPACLPPVTAHNLCTAWHPIRFIYNCSHRTDRHVGLLVTRNAALLRAAPRWCRAWARWACRGWRRGRSPSRSRSASRWMPEHSRRLQQRRPPSHPARQLPKRWCRHPLIIMPPALVVVMARGLRGTGQTPYDPGCALHCVFVQLQTLQMLHMPACVVALPPRNLPTL